MTLRDTQRLSDALPPWLRDTNPQIRLPELPLEMPAELEREPPPRDERDERPVDPFLRRS